MAAPLHVPKGFAVENRRPALPEAAAGSGEVEPLRVGAVHRVEGVEHEGQGEGEGEGVRDGLSGHEAHEAEEMVSDEDGGQEQDALPRRGDDAGGQPDR